MNTVRNLEQTECGRDAATLETHSPYEQKFVCIMQPVGHMLYPKMGVFSCVT